MEGLTLTLVSISATLIPGPATPLFFPRAFGAAFGDLLEGFQAGLVWLIIGAKENGDCLRAIQTNVILTPFWPWSSLLPGLPPKRKGKHLAVCGDIRRQIARVAAMASGRVV